MRYVVSENFLATSLKRNIILLPTATAQSTLFNQLCEFFSKIGY